MSLGFQIIGGELLSKLFQKSYPGIKQVLGAPDRPPREIAANLGIKDSISLAQTPPSGLNCDFWRWDSEKGIYSTDPEISPVCRDLFPLGQLSGDAMVRGLSFAVLFPWETVKLPIDNFLATIENLDKVEIDLLSHKFFGSPIDDLIAEISNLND